MTGDLNQHSSEGDKNEFKNKNQNNNTISGS